MSLPTEGDPLHPDPARPERLRWEDWVGAGAMALMAIITFGNVLVRYFTDESFAWTEEFSIWLMVVLTMVAASAAVARDRHIRIEAFFEGGSPQRRRALALLSAACTVLAFGILTVLAVRFFYDDYKYDVTSPGIGLPQWWYSIWLPLLALAITLRGVQVLIRKWRSR